MSKLGRLYSVISAVCPIEGISVPTIGSSVDVRIDYLPVATAVQRAAAQTTLISFDWSDAAQAAWEKTTKDAAEPDLAALRDLATQAVADINTFLAIANPTNAQTLAEVKAIDQRQRAIIKALARLIAKTL